MRRIFILSLFITLIASIFFVVPAECRYYDPKTGRFLQRDPVETDDENTYTYVYNDPINLVDPYGEQGLPPNFYPPLPAGVPPIEQSVFPPSLGEDLGLPAPPIPGQYASANAKRKEKIETQEGTSETITHVAIEKAKDKGQKDKKKKQKEPKNETDRKVKDIQQNPQDWEKTGEKRDPKGNSWRELWRNRKTGETLERHRLDPDPRGRHPHWGPVKNF